MTKIRDCMENDCPYPAAPGKRKCYWHGLLKLPIEEQIAAAEERREAALLISHGAICKRVGAELWPAGERFCAGCQGFVPLFYCTGSRCKAHNALAAHSGRLESTYGIDRATYVALLALQDGKCYVCHQLPRTKRLAVDHDHKTGEVRGLLCADVERGCNHAVLGSLEARSVDGVVAAAYRLIDYMTKTPYQRLKEAPHDPKEPVHRAAAEGGREDGLPDDRTTVHLPSGATQGAPGVPLPDVSEVAAVPDWAAAQLR